MNTSTEACNFPTANATGGIRNKLILHVREWVRIQGLKYQLKLERRLLLEMSEDQLRDIGISRAEAMAEAASTAIPMAR